jgi:prefoldin beta subunit
MEQENEKIQEIQILEQNMQNLLLQKQAFEMEISETEAALEEIENSGDDVYKIAGGILIKSSKQKIKSELEGKKKLLEMKIKSFEKQEALFSSRINSVRDDIMKHNKK